MDKRVYLLTVISFVVGMVELIIGGILDLVADDLQISIGTAGLLISVFSLVFAISAPILLYISGQADRKKVMIVSLIIFTIGNVAAALSPSFAILLIARVITAASGSLLVILCITIASNIVDKHYIGRAIGIVVMGVSGSLVLGVPIGLSLGHIFNWRAPFLLIAGLSIVMMFAVTKFLGYIEAQPTVPIKQQLQTLKNPAVLFAHATTFLFLAGHYTFYAYFTPFLVSTFGFGGSMLSFMYFLFGIAAVSGGGLSGVLTDRFNPRLIVIISTCSFALTLFLIPYVTFAVPVFLLFVIVWGMLNWMITPPLQRYLIEIEPKTAGIQQSLNNSSLHLGIAFGALVGSAVVERADVHMTSFVGGCIVILSIGTAALSIRASKKSQSSE